MRQTAMSARLPAAASRCRRGGARPRRRACRAAAPRAPSARAGPPRPRATSSAFFTSMNRSLRSFDALPSTPSPTRTPASSRSRTGATPAPRRRFDVGQCATPTPFAPNVATSASERWTQCAHQTSLGEPADALEVLDRGAAEQLAAVRVLLDGLGEVRVQLQPEPPRQRGRLLHQPRRHGERRARCDGDLHAAPPSAERGEPLGVGEDRRRGPRRASRAAGRRPTRRGPSSRVRRRCARRARARRASPPRRAPRRRAGRRSGGRTPSCSRTARARRARTARRRTPSRRRSAPTPGRASSAT